MRGKGISSRINKANDPGVSYLMYYSQFTKVFVQSHEDAPFIVGACKNFLITWIFRPVTGPHNIMAGRLEIFPSPAPHARIQKDFHP